MVNILNDVKKMIECGELRVISKNFDGTFTGMTVENNGQTVIVLNANLSYEYNLHKFLHEIIHLKHINTNINVAECERQALEYEKNFETFANLISVVE
ncbi:carbonic anhydrase family protein [Clostridium sp. HBUAS56017]|jgi:Zn-dependent peptidase ImmA (M78 family)|uniref:carbonic anhydrase family protein n=1 Tax=Clostridium sp. HBUAS56017 TaxID=2571128 RepID=UPI0011776D9D|nr:carbonic anhydrase family protein [Clostridium sp. HBUAS56017]